MAWRVAALLLLLAGCGGGRSGEPTSLQCAPYARQASGIQLYGDAATWWDEAAGRYRRTRQPQSGGVLVFRRTRRLPHGHVSTVTGVGSARRITVLDANWVPGEVTRDEPVVDVSPGNDWSAVRVWWPPSGHWGGTVYPTYGFILPTPPAPAPPLAAVGDRPMW
jgi:surface antigen